MADASSARGSRRIPTVLCFDAEDIVAPETDDAARWLAEILTECGLTGTFMVVGEKARLWERRGRQDVIEAVKRHQIAFHSTWHSVHPTTTEHCLQTDFARGMAALWEWDRDGIADAERILGRPLLGWGRTGNSWAPSVQGLMGRMGRGYIYSPIRLPEHNVCWYAGCLGFYDDGIGGFDPTYCSDALFEEHLSGVKDRLDTLDRSSRRGADWLCFFLGHPTRVVSTMFWDAVNFTAGANPPRSEWKPAPLQDPTLVPSMQKNYRRLCEYIRANERLEVVGWGDLIRRFDGQRPFMTHTELLEIAQCIADERQVLFTDFFTAGEILMALCSAAATPRQRYPRTAVYGPLTTPPISTDAPMAATAVRDAARTVLEVAQTGYLPAAVNVAGERIGIGTFFVALAEALLGRESVSGPKEAPYPLVAEDVAREVEQIVPEWVIHPKEMDMTRLLEQTRLQCWTLKPAWPREALSL